MKKIILFFIFNIFLFAALLNKTDIALNNKPVILFFSSKTCVYCEIFKKDIIKNKKLKQIISKFDVYEIKRDEYKEYKLWGQKTNIRVLERTFAIKATPNFIVFDKKGRKIWQIPGYADPDMMVSYLNFVIGLDNNKYKITDWFKYLQKEGIIK